MKLVFLSITLAFVVSAYSQTAQLKAVAPTITVPDAATVSTTALSNYFKEKYPSDTARLRAIFTWVATNIEYDVENMFLLTHGEGKEDKIAKALKTRTAVCEGYAELFNEICIKSGFQSMVIPGYTKQKGMVDQMPHLWVAVKLNNSWQLFDPTWSSGSVYNNKFLKGFSYRFYQVKPEELIKTHMPFDPMHQFLKRPITSKDFYEGNLVQNIFGSNFNFDDTLALHLKLNETDQIRNTARRIEANGVRSSMIMQMLQYLKNKELNIQSEVLNAASVIGNEAVSSYNRYIEYKNKQFTPKKEDPEIEEMLLVVQAKLDSAKTMTASIATDDASFKRSITQVNAGIEDLQKLLNEEKLFVSKYIKTKKLLRPMLFRKIG